MQTLPKRAFPDLPNSFPVPLNFLPCSAELTSLIISSRELARKPRKFRADSGALAVEKARKNQNSLIIPCIRCKTGQTERLSTLAETGGENGGIIGGDCRLRCQCGMPTHGNTGEIRAEPDNRGRDRGWWRRRWDSNPRKAFTHVGFQDRCIKPLCHSSDDWRLTGFGAILKADTRRNLPPCPRSLFMFASVG